MKVSSTALLCVLASSSSSSSSTSSHVSAFSTPTFGVTPRSLRSSFVPSVSHVTRTAARKNWCRSSTGSASTTATSRSTKQSSMVMFTELPSGGMEQLQELTDAADSIVLSKQVRKSPSLFKMAGMATIPLSAALGFGLVPSRRLAAHTVGAVVSGLAGAVGKSRLDALTEDNAKPALAQAILDHGLSDATQTTAAVKAVQEQFGLLDEDFEALCLQIYSTYLLGMVKYSPNAKTSELKELETLKAVLSLDNLHVGEAHSLAASEWYRTTCLFTPEEELDDADHPDRQAMDKFLFLTERALRQGGETDEAFLFEMSRVAKALQLDLSVAMDRVAETAEPFYARALKSTRAKLGSNQVSAAMLERARTTLGIADETAFDMHVASFNDEVRELLGLANISSGSSSSSAGSSASLTSSEDQNAGNESHSPTYLGSVKFPDGAIERLDLLKEVLELSDTDAQYEIALEVTPLYQSTALTAMREVLAKEKTPDQAWDSMDQRRVDLGLKEESSKSLLTSMVMQALGGPLEETNKFSKVNNEAATFDHLLEALVAKEALISILEKSGWEEFDLFDETFCNPWDKKSANGFLTSEERMKMYRIFLNRSVAKSASEKMDDDTYARIKEVQGLLGITDMQAEIEARGAFGKKLQRVLSSAMNEIVADYTPELAENMQKEVTAVMENYRLNEGYLRESGVSFYAKAVELVSDKSPSGVPAKELSTALAAFRDICKLTVEETYPSHMEHFGTVYKKSVLEAMGQTGVIRPEFRESLAELRERLGVSEDNTRKLYLNAVEDKMKPMVQWIGSELERTMLSQQQLSKRRGKDMGEDVFQSGKGADGVLGLGAEVNIMSDIMELVDFYVENNLIEQSESGSVYPITGLGLGAIDQEVAELLYRQFIVGAFQTQGPNAARYEASRETFAGILGLTEAKKDDIGKTIGSTVYDNFVTNAMNTKGSMDQQDMMFLANIQGKLGLTSEQGESMLMNTQKKILSEELEALMDKPSPDPEGIKSFREKCNSLGLDLMKDVGVSKQRLARMFDCEVIPGLKSGLITAEDSDLLGEIQESIGIEPEDCEVMFEKVLGNLAKNAFSVVAGEILRGRDDNTVDLIKELVRYAAFTDGNLGLEVDEATGNKILNLYQALDFEGLDDEQIESNYELLRSAMGLSV